MLEISNDGYRVINSGSLSIQYLYEIHYGLEVKAQDGAISYVDVDGNPCEPLRYTSMTDFVTYADKTYTPMVIFHDDMTQDTSGAITETSLTVGNYDRVIQEYIELYTLEGKVVEIVTLVMDSNLTIVTSYFAEYRIKTISAKEDSATFTLSSGLDILSITFPNRIARGLYCRWKFKGADCKYSGIDESCTLNWNDCYTKGNTKNFGGFPGIINEKFYF